MSVPQTNDTIAPIISAQAESLIHKIKHYLITTMGVTVDEASNQEFYRAFVLALREEIMINWTATAHTYRKKQTRLMNYLCMEYMPGRLFGNNITNMHAMDLVKLVSRKMNHSLIEALDFEREAGLGNGGLGRLAACILDALASQQYPARGYGLRYQYGIFQQEIWAGSQIERPDIWLLSDNPWEYKHDAHSALVNFCGRTVPTLNKKNVPTLDIVDYDEIRAVAYDIPIVGYKESSDYNVVTLRLWSTKESPRNFQLQRYNAGQIDQAGENSSITDVLYPNDNHDTGKRIRLKQEFLLVSASLQDIIHHHLHIYGNMTQFADKVRIQINDTHPALAIAEMMRLLIKPFDFEWNDAFEVVKVCFGYTNHTVLKESLEEWNQSRLNYLLPRQYHIIERLNLELCELVRKRYPGDEEKVRRMSMIESGQIRMAHLAIYGSHRINGVSELHTEILKRDIFKDFFEVFPEKFVNITNGVTQRRWLLYANPRLSEFISNRIGTKWIEDFSQIKQLSKFAGDPASQQEFLRLKKENKKDLISFLRDKNPIRDAKGKIVDFFPIMDEEALFDVQIKRFHEYKRQLMNALHVIMIYHELKNNPEARKIKRMVIFAGKAAPGYEMAKNIIQLIFCLARKINSDPLVSNLLRVAFIEDYNVSKAELIIPAADLSEQLSMAGKEASGTGNIKLSMNGALTIATRDGSNIELERSVGEKWWPFGFGNTAEDNVRLQQSGTYQPWEICMRNPAVRAAVDSLRDQSFAENESEHTVLSSIYQNLVGTQYPEVTDRYFILNDLERYYQTQKKVEELFLQPSNWAECALQNIAGTGSLSIDASVGKYAAEVWDLPKCVVDREEVKRAQDARSEHDKCRVF